MATADETTFSEKYLDTRRKYRDRLNSAVRRNTMELRRLQTDRHLNERWNLALPTPAGTRGILRFEKTNPNRPPPPRLQRKFEKTNPFPTPSKQPNPASTPKSKPRNAANSPNSPKGQS